ncbi:MAG: EAL domain-containing protein [Xanthomonadales bacterium]|nr:EAL domain-containing protein [Xanthomonadales bacterium]
MKSDDVLRLLVIESSLEDAEHLLSTLRNAGIAVRPSSADDADELQGALERKPLDLILFNPNHDEFDISGVADAVTRCGKDVPVIAVLDEYAEEAELIALQQGATDVASTENPEHLVAVVQRVNDNMLNRRRLRFIESSLREAEKRCHALLDSSRDAIAYVHEGMHVYANPAYLQLYDYDDFEELEGLPVLDMVSGEDAGQLKGVLQGLSKGEPPPEHIEVNLQLPSGATKPSYMEFSNASIEGEPCTQVVLRDKSVDPEMVKQLKDLKSQDLVTGLYNRQHILQAVDEALGQVVQGSAGPYSVLFLEIDNFKESMDQVGLAGVDLVLSDLAGVIRQQLPDGATAARFGDQSFAILAGEDLSGAEKLGESLRAGVEAHISEVGGQSITLSVSVGLTSIIESAPTAQDLLTMASGAAQVAQEEGGNRVQVHDPVKQRPGEDGGLQWIAVVKDAVEANRLVLVFQPIVSLHGEEKHIYEVLFRLQTQEGEEVLPGEFMPALANHELGVQVDRWIIENAMAKLKDHQDTVGQPVVFFIKLLPQTLSDQTLLPWLAKHMQTHRLNGDNFVFEMPESKLMTNLKPAKQFVKGLKQLHCKFAIEQFGSGLNSFQILKHVPADFLKIDRTFMPDLPKNEENQSKVRELAQQAQAQGKVTVAEFVEDAASMSILWQSGVNYVQGNFLQEPTKVMTYEFA